MNDPVRVAVTGAAGQIGYSLLFRIASGQMLGPDQPVILQMLDITPAMDALKGVAMELEDCAFPLLAGMVQTDDPNVAFGDVSYALLVGARRVDEGLLQIGALRRVAVDDHLALLVARDLALLGHVISAPLGSRRACG